MDQHDVEQDHVIEEVLASYDERRAFYRLDDADKERLRAFRDDAIELSSEIIDPLYEHLLAFAATRRHFQSDAHVNAVKETQREYLKRLFDGSYDREYARDRLGVGITHERIALEPAWYIGAYSLYLCRVLDLIMARHEDDAQTAVELFQSVIKIVNLDMSMAIDTYIGAMRRREQEAQGRFVEALNQYSETLGDSSKGILEATASQSVAAQEQATSVTEITTTLGELRQTSAQALERAEEVVLVSERSIETSASGSEAVEAAIQGMREIRSQVDAIAEKILMLSEQSQQIGEIIASVNEIAEQSKLVAFNASIEAGRAGEHGKGFAVVATEIRSLADQSKQATGQVRQLLSEIQSAINSAVVATEEGSKRAEAGTQLANRSGQTIHELAQSIEESANAARLIANASRQQAAGIEQASDAMSQINDAMNNAVAALQQTEEKTRALGRMTVDMGEVIASFTSAEASEAEYRLA